MLIGFHIYYYDDDAAADVLLTLCVDSAAFVLFKYL